MSARLVDIILDLGKRLADRDLPYARAIRVAAKEQTVDPVTLRQACAELGEDWARQVYESARAGHQKPEEIYIDDSTVVSDLISSDRASTESGEHTTVNQLILRLASLRDADHDVGEMRIVYGPSWTPVVQATVEADRDAPLADQDYVMVLR